MFERILWCLAGSVALWLGLVYLSTDATGGIGYATFYFDSCVAVAVLVSAIVVFVVPLVLVRVLHARPLPTDHETALVNLSEEVERWRWPATTVSVLEAYKRQLRQIEERARYLQASERQVRRFSEENPGAFALWLAERGLSILRKQCFKESGTAESLRQAIERLHSGDVDREVDDFREQIAQLVAERNRANMTDSWYRGIDAKIRACERSISELERWRDKVAAATTSPYENAWADFLDLAKRTAAAPLVEAVSRVESARAGLHIKRHYEDLVDREWRNGSLSDDEANVIRQRVREEFGGGRNVSTGS